MMWHYLTRALHGFSIGFVPINTKFAQKELLKWRLTPIQPTYNQLLRKCFMRPTALSLGYENASPTDNTNISVQKKGTINLH